MHEHTRKKLLHGFFRHNSMRFFTKYLPLLLQPETFPGAMLAMIIHKREGYSLPSAKSRVCNARAIIKQGHARAALAYIAEVANPNRTGADVVRNAEKLLAELPADV